MADGDPILVNANFDYSTKPKTLINPSKTFKIIRTLGAGSLGEVVLIMDLNTKKLYALKLIKDIDPINFADSIDILKKLSAYPNCNKDIVCYYDDFQMKNKNNETVYAILMEYIEGTDLDDAIFYLTDKNIFEIALWLTSVLSYVHKHGIVHHDIGTTNIMITSDNRLKLIDFEATPAMASESKNRNYFYRQDDWMAAILLYAIANNGDSPYRHDYDEITNTNHSELIPSNFKYQCFNDVLRSMLALDEKLRISSAEANVLFQECYNEHLTQL